MSASSHNNLAQALNDIGTSAKQSGRAAGEAMLSRVWPHAGTPRTARSITDRQRLKVFKADGFRCHYTGELLLFPPYLRALR